MAKEETPLFEEFIDFCLRQCKLPDLEKRVANGPEAEELTKWNLTPEEWRIALDRAIDEYKELGPRGAPPA